MAVSRSSGHDRREVRRTQGRDWFPDLTRYDVVLTAIPALFALSLFAHVVLGLSLLLAIQPTAVASAALLADALYFNPPTAETGRGS